MMTIGDAQRKNYIDAIRYPLMRTALIPNRYTFISFPTFDESVTFLSHVPVVNTSAQSKVIYLSCCVHLNTGLWRE